MAEEKEWYKKAGVIITLALAITPVIISQIVGVYINIINSPTDFQVSLDSVSIGTKDALIQAPSTPGGDPIMVISNKSRIMIRDCHCINPYSYEIFLRVVQQAAGINISFDPEVLQLPDNDSSAITAKVSSDVLSGSYPIEIEAVGGDGTKHRCYCIITVEKSYESNIKGEKSYRTDVEIREAETPMTGAVVVNSSSSTSHVSDDRDLRPSGDVRRIEVAQEGQKAQPTTEVG